MLNSLTGTYVPPSLDSPKEQPDFKQVNLPNFPETKKHPIMAVSLRPLPDMKFEVTIARRNKSVKVYTVGPCSALRLTFAVNNLRHKSKTDVCPSIIGWTAYIDRSVYPPPSESETLMVPVMVAILLDPELGNKVKWGVP